MFVGLCAFFIAAGTVLSRPSRSYRSTKKEMARPMAQHLCVIFGPMFGGKTTLLAEMIRSVKGGKLVFKHASDQARRLGKLSGHDDALGDIEAIPIQNALQVEEYLEADTNVIYIDEAQFFELSSFVKLLDGLARTRPHVSIVVAGLDHASNGEAWPTTMGLLARATEMHQRLPDCACCGGAAHFTYFKNHATEAPRVGGSKLYEPRCAICFKRDMPAA
jgi:thymidine kinase